MLRKEDFAVIKALHERGVYQKDIAEQLGVHPKTVSRALKRDSAPASKRAKRDEKLDPFKPTVDRMLSEGVWNAVVILRAIQAEGYTGKSTMLRLYIQPKRALRQGRITVRFETPPGRQLQSDWGELVVEIAGVLTKVYFIVNELAYSRRFHFWCTDSCDAEHTYEGLVRSFEYFGGYMCNRQLQRVCAGVSCREDRTPYGGLAAASVDPRGRREDSVQPIHLSFRSRGALTAAGFSPILGLTQEEGERVRSAESASSFR